MKSGLVPSFALLALLLCALSALAAFGLIHVGGPGGTHLGARGFGAVLGFFFITAAIGTVIPSQRAHILLAASLLQLFFLHGVAGAAGALAIWSGFYVLMQSGPPWWMKCAGVAAILIAPRVILHLYPGSALFGVLVVALTATNFVYRSVLYAYESGAQKEFLAGAGYRGFLTYLAAPPLGAVQAPPIGFGVLHQALRREADAVLIRSGTGQIALGALYLVLNHAGRVQGIIPAHRTVVASAGELNALTVTTASILLLTGLFLDLIGHVHLSIGMMRVLGFELAPGSERPLLAGNVLEFWRRWNTYYRDFLMTLAFYPVARALRRRPYVAVITGGALTFLLSGLAHAVAQLAPRGGPITLRRFLDPQVLFTVEGFLVVIWMVREAAAFRRRRRTKGAVAAPDRTWTSRARGAASIAITISVVSLIYAVFRHPFGGNVPKLLGALTRLPW